MRITGGIAKGRVLPSPTQSHVRPTSARVREAIFSMIGQDLSGQSVLDPFGGSGVLAAEAWSRGGEVTVIERSGRQVRALHSVSRSLAASWSILRGDCLAMVGSLGSYDIVLADPPYATVDDQLIERLSVCVGGLLVLEAQRDALLSDRIANLTRVRRKQYGNTSVHVYERYESE